MFSYQRWNCKNLISGKWLLIISLTLSSSIFCQTTKRINLRLRTVTLVLVALRLLSKKDTNVLRNCFKNAFPRNTINPKTSLNGVTGYVKVFITTLLVIAVQSASFSTGKRLPGLKSTLNFSKDNSGYENTGIRMLSLIFA